MGDGATDALVGRDGAVSWLCVPRFDSPPPFCGLLNARRGGRFVVAPEDLVESRQFYEPDTRLLVAEMRGRSRTVVRVTDAMTLRSGADLAEDGTARRSRSTSSPSPTSRSGRRRSHPGRTSCVSGSSPTGSARG